MAIRFSTEAANADILGEDAEDSGKPEGLTRPAGTDGAPAGANGKAEETRPGKDINAAGFIKDKDAAKP